MVQVLKRSAKGLIPVAFVAAVLAASWAAPIQSPAFKLVATCGSGGYGYGGLANVSGVSPISGTTAGGTVVVITGCGFTGATAVHFGATAAASKTVNSDTQITATSPAHAAGFVDVTVTTASGTSPASPPADQFEFIAPNSSCTSASVSPASGTFGAGTQLVFTASSHGCLLPRYAFWIQSPDGAWHFKQDFPSATYTWDTSGLNGVYNIHVWVNTSGNSYDAIGSATVTISPCSAGMISPPTTSVQTGTTINFTASSSGCATPRYAYFIQYPDMSWHFVRDFGAAAFAWNTAGLAPGVYTVHAWVNTAGTGYDTFGTSTVTLTGCASASVSPPTPTAKTPTTIVFTASATGCTSPRFSWWIQYTSFDGSWHFLQDFPSATLSLNTTGLGPGTYTIHVWANVTGTGHDAVGSATLTLT